MPAGDSTVLVRLRLLGAAPFSAKAKTSAASLGTVGTAATGAAAKLKGVSAAFGTAGAAAMTGAAAMRRLALPMVAIAGVSGKLAMDFEESMSKIVGLVGIARPEVDAMGESVLQLANKMPQSPKELSEALFFITSAGLRGKEAMDALNASARAAAGGLGETKVVADAVTSAMNAYAKAGLTGEQATDVLTAAVREGKAEADSFAPAFGKVLPIASEMGLEFNEIAAAMATMTRTGSSARESATALRSIMSAAAKPTVQMKEGLEAVGMSVQGLRDRLANRGLLDTLSVLRDRAKENGVDMAQLFGNVRGLGGVFQLVGKNAAATDGVFKGLNASTGATDKAFEEAAKTAKFRFQSALSTLQVIGIRIGRVILPVVASAVEKVVGTIGKLFDAFRGGKGPGAIKSAFSAIKSAVMPVVNGLRAGLDPSKTKGMTEGFSGVAGVAVKVGRAFRGIPGVVGRVLDAFRPAQPFLENVLLPLLKGIAIGVIGGVVAAFNILIPVVKLVMTALGFLGRLLSPLKVVFVGIGAVIGFLAGGPILMLFKGLGKLGVVFRILGGMVRFVNAIFGKAIGILGHVFRWFGKVYQGVIRFVATFRAAPAQVIKAAHNLLTGVVNTVAKLPGKLFKFAKDAGGKVISGITGVARTGLGAIGTAFTKVGKAILDAVVNAIKDAPGAIMGAITSIVPDKLKGAVGKIIPGGATGGRVARGGAMIVGEQGPELVNFPTDTRIANASDTRRIVRGAGQMQRGEIKLVANLFLSGKQIHEEVFRIDRALVEAT